MKKVLVTGSSRGIGRAIAIALARAGHDPVIHCVSSFDAANVVAKEVKAFGASGDVLAFDVSNRAECKAALGRTQKFLNVSACSLCREFQDAKCTAHFHAANHIGNKAHFAG